MYEKDLKQYPHAVLDYLFLYRVNLTISPFRKCFIDYTVDFLKNNVVMLYCVMLCDLTSLYVMLLYVFMPCYVTLRCVVLCYVTSRYVTLYRQPQRKVNNMNAKL